MDKPVKHGKLEYRCRRCGQVFSGLFSSDVFQALIEIDLYGETQSFIGGIAKKTNIHIRCSDGNFGIGDIIGASFNEE